MPVRTSYARVFIEALDCRQLLAAITSNQLIAGSIAANGQSQSYTFHANASDHVSIVVGYTGGVSFVPIIAVRSPSNVLLTSGEVQSYEAALPASGTYTIVVSESGDNNTGTYALSLIQVPAAQAPEADSGPIASNEYHTGSITTADQDIYTFAANAGDSISLAVGATGGVSFSPYLEFFSPGGALLTSGSPTSFDKQNLPATGTYYIVVRDLNDDNTGTYALTLMHLPATQVVDADSGPIQSNQRVTGFIDVGDEDVYTFSANAGDSVSLVTGQLDFNNLSPYIQLYSPTGALLSANSSVDQANLPLTGTYYVLVRDVNDDNTGRYALSFAKYPAAQQTDLTDQDGGTLTSGQSRSGAIDFGDLDVYTVSLTAGVAASVQMTRLSGGNFTCALAVYSPTGVLLGSDFGSATVAVALNNPPVSGTYYVVAREQGDDNTGNYSISLNATPAPDTRAPGSTSARFDYDPLHAIFATNEAITSLDPTDVSVAHAGGGVVALTGTTASFNSRANEITFQFDSSSYATLPDGNYVATLEPGSVVDTAGNSLAPGAAVPFFVLAGDSNHDRKVNALDFNALASNFGRFNAVYSQGDFDYSGRVDTADFTLLAAKFGHTLAPPSGALPARSSADLFASSPIRRDIAFINENSDLS